MPNRFTPSLIHFDHPFQCPGSDQFYPPGDYKIIREDEAIEGISWMAYRCKSMCIDIPSKGKTERHIVTQDELSAMVERDTRSSERPHR